MYFTTTDDYDTVNHNIVSLVTNYITNSPLWLTVTHVKLLRRHPYEMVWLWVINNVRVQHILNLCSVQFPVKKQDKKISADTFL